MIDKVSDSVLGYLLNKEVIRNGLIIYNIINRASNLFKLNQSI